MWSLTINRSLLSLDYTNRVARSKSRLIIFLCRRFCPVKSSSFKSPQKKHWSKSRMNVLITCLLWYWCIFGRLRNKSKVFLRDLNAMILLSDMSSHSNLHAASIRPARSDVLCPWRGVVLPRLSSSSASRSHSSLICLWFFVHFVGHLGKLFSFSLKMLISPI